MGERVRVDTGNVLAAETYLVAEVRDQETDQSARQMESEGVDAADQEDLESPCEEKEREKEKIPEKLIGKGRIQAKEKQNPSLWMMLTCYQIQC